MLQLVQHCLDRLIVVCKGFAYAVRQARIVDQFAQAFTGKIQVCGTAVRLGISALVFHCSRAILATCRTPASICSLIPSSNSFAAVPGSSSPCFFNVMTRLRPSASNIKAVGYRMHEAAGDCSDAGKRLQSVAGDGETQRQRFAGATLAQGSGIPRYRGRAAPHQTACRARASLLYRCIPG